MKRALWGGVSFCAVVLGWAAMAFSQPADEADSITIEETTPSPALRILRALVPGVATPVEGVPPTEAGEEKVEVAPESEVSASVAKPAVPVNPREFKFVLKDGSVIAGEMTIDQIEVATEFGKLTIPVGKITSFVPGLNSRPELLQQVNGLIEALGNDDYKMREAAHKELAGLGELVRLELAARAADENAERKRHVQEILKELDQRAEEREADEEGGESTVAWIRGDSVVTTDFTIVGKISVPAFEIKSKYGPLTIQLGDVARGHKEVGGRQEIRRSLSVDGTNLAQMSWKNSSLRVEKGDRISVRADGSIIMSPWGEVPSSPDGGANFGWYVNNQIPGGALMARVGTGGKVVKVGSTKTFVAETSGTLYFAIAMQHQYARQGYNFPGQYNVRVKVGGE